MIGLTRRLAALIAALAIVFCGTQLARATVVGDIQACYKCSNNFGNLGMFDGLTLLFENTSGNDITNAVFQAGIGGWFEDSFSLGTIAAGTSVIIIPNVSSDGNIHYYFNSDGSIRYGFFKVGPDMSDWFDWDVNHSTQFEFTGMIDAFLVDSGIFTPLQSAGPSNDGSLAMVDFLGVGSDNDDVCNDCFGPKVIATFSTASPPSGPSPVPEPATIVLFATGLLIFGFASRRRR
jgi:hypothetical protein